MSWDVGAWVINTLKKLIETHGVQEFTANGTFVVPAGVHKIWVTACGGGGGGGGGYRDNNGSGGQGGGGGACIHRKAYAVVPGQSISITLGAAGTAGTSSTTASSVKAGGNGGSTVIGALVTLPGGNGGKGNASSGWARSMPSSTGVPFLTVMARSISRGHPRASRC